MPNFSYRAISPDGNREVGRIEAETKARALEQLNKLGLVPIEVTEASHLDHGPWWSRDIAIFGSIIKPRDIASFFQTFSTMLDARLPMKSVLEYTMRQTTAKPLERALSAVIRDVENGEALTIAMKKHHRVFDPRYVTILEIGERANAINIAATQCAEMIRVEQEMKSELRAALIYPSILMLMAIAVIGIVLFHLTPTLAPVFAQAGAELPTSMRIMLSVRNTVITSWPTILLIALLLLAFTVLLVKTLSYVVEGILLKLPFIGQILKDRECQRLANTLYLMLKSGAGLPEALKLAKGSTGWRQYQNLIDHTLSTVNSGGKLSDSLATSPLISPILQNMLEVGEKSDLLIPLLETASTILQKSHREAVQLALKLLTPALTLLIGGAVGGLIFSTMSAIMDINDVVF